MRMERVSRSDLLSVLESVQPGLSPRDIVEQSGSFVFRKGRILTYNEEVCCKTKSGLPKEFTGAVKHKAFMDLLRKLKDEVVSLEVKGGFLVISGRNNRRQAKLRMESEITIPLDELEQPGEWRPLPEDFGDAVNIVQGCAGSDDTQFAGVCIHLHPKWIEATDGFQVARYRIALNTDGDMMVRKDAVKHVIPLDMTEMSVTDKWVHFRNPTGLVLSCRRYVEDYPDLKTYFQVEGVKTSLPKGLSDAVDVATIFSRENADSNLVVVELRPGEDMIVTGVGTSGEYSERKKIVYTGKPLRFTIPPEILTEVAVKHNECTLSNDRLMVGGEKWRFVTTLGDPDTKSGSDVKDKPSKKEVDERSEPDED